MIKIELIYLTPHTNYQRHYAFQTPVSIETLLKQSDLFVCFPEFINATLSIGIFSKPVDLKHFIQDGDRVEIYRPLELDPKEHRLKNNLNSKKNT